MTIAVTNIYVECPEDSFFGRSHALFLIFWPFAYLGRVRTGCGWPAAPQHRYPSKSRVGKVTLSSGDPPIGTLFVRCLGINRNVANKKKQNGDNVPVSRTFSVCS